jgi:hypothetical protein
MAIMIPELHRKNQFSAKCQWQPEPEPAVSHGDSDSDSEFKFKLGALAGCFEEASGCSSARFKFRKLER